MLRLFIFTIFLCCSSALATEWEKLSGCKLVKESYRDGDSFHIQHRGKIYIIRLYFVDTPEAYQKGGDHNRTTTQAKYFNIYKKDLYHIASQATDFTAKALDKRFTVWTCWKDAKSSFSGTKKNP